MQKQKYQQEQSEFLKTNRRYRREYCARQDGRVRGGRKRLANEHGVNDHRAHRDNQSQIGKEGKESQIDFNYLRVSLELLHSMTPDIRLRTVLKKMIRQVERPPPELMTSRRRNIHRIEQSVMSTVFWPNLWDGIWKQFALDVPRSNIHFHNQRFANPSQLFQALETSFGSLWARWICLFLNQAPMADVFTCVSRDVELKYGRNFLLCEGGSSSSVGEKDDNNFSFNVHVEHVCTNTQSNVLQIVMMKNFLLRNMEDDDESQKLGDPSGPSSPSRAQTKYVITLYPVNSARLTWSYK